MICPSCFGNGKTTCAACNGKGTLRAVPNRSGGLDFPVCAVCGGTGHMRCAQCGGNRNVPDPSPPPIQKETLVGRWVLGNNVNEFTISIGSNGYLFSIKGYEHPSKITISGNKVRIQYEIIPGMDNDYEAIIVGDQLIGGYMGDDGHRNSANYRKQK